MAHDITILTEAELRALVPLDRAAVDVVEQAFTALASGDVIMPPVMSMDIPAANAEVDVKTAYIPGFDSFAIKVSPGFFNNPGLGLPSLNGLMVVFSAETGLVEAVLLDNGYLTDVRTAAAGAVAALHLAPQTETAGVLGTGVQARLQIEAARLVRPFRRVLVWGRDAEKAKACARDIAERLALETVCTPEPETVLRQSELVITATPSRDPLIDADWLHAGLHLTAMGADQAGKNEIDPAAFGRIDTYVPDRLSQCIELGELQSALAAGVVTATDAFADLGQVVRDPDLGRRSPHDITLCDLTGTGAQDTAIASFALQRARERSVGSQIRA